MFNYVTPYESTHALLVLAIIAVIVGVAFYFGNRQYQDYALKKLTKEQTHNKDITGMNLQATKENKTIELQTIQAKTLMIAAEGGAQDRKFPENPKVVDRNA